MFLWGLKRVLVTRGRGFGERYLPFTELTMAVILGVVIQDTALSINRGFTFANYRAILLVTALLMFVEMYIVFSRYHHWLRLPYVNLYIFFDLLNALLFVLCVLLINDSWDRKEQLDRALVMLALLFLALLIRQVVSFVNLVLRSADVESIVRGHSLDEQLAAINLDLVFRNRDLRAKLKKINFAQWGLFIPMIADLLGVVFALAGLVAFNLSWWSWVGLGSMLAYELIMFGLIIGGVSPARNLSVEEGGGTSVEDRIGQGGASVETGVQ